MKNFSNIRADNEEKSHVGLRKTWKESRKFFFADPENFFFDTRHRLSKMPNQNNTQNQFAVTTAGGSQIVCQDQGSMQLVADMSAQLKRVKANGKRKAEALNDVRKVSDSYTNGFNKGDIAEYNWGDKKSLHHIIGFQPVLGPALDGSTVGPERKFLKKAVPFENLKIHKAKYVESDSDED